MARSVAAISITGAALMVVLLMELSGLLPRLELLAWDARLATGLGRREPGGKIVVAWVDQESMDYLRRMGVPFPWPRSVYEQAARYALQGGARAIVFDILFSEPGAVAVDDREFGAFLAEAGGTVNAFKFVAFREGGFTEEETEAMRGRGFDPAGLAARPADRGFVLPIPEIEAPSAGLGFVNVRPDLDRVHRGYDLVRLWEGKAYPSLALAGALAALGPDALGVKDGRLELDGRPIPLDGQGRMALNFRGPEFTFEHVKLINIVESINLLEEGQEPLYPLERFKDKIVIFGINAEGYEDIAPTPLSQVFPGPELHATALDNLLAGDPLRPSDLGLPLAVLAAAGAAALVFRLPGTMLPALAVAALGLLMAGGSLAAFAGGHLVTAAGPLASLASSAGGAFLYRLVVEGKSRRELRRAFTSYMAPEIVAQVLENPDQVQLGGQTREVTLFFSDLKGFTGLAEAMEPQELVAFLNDYFTRMCDHVMAQGGVVDKFIGDAIMAMWGAPLDQPDHGARALQAALGMLEELETLNRELAGKGRPTVGMRIGLNTGPAVVGNMGSSRRFDYTAMGDTVNLASRLEGANKAFGTACMASATTWAMAGADIVGREIGNVRVVGREAPIAVFEPLCRAGAAEPLLLEFLGRYNAALDAIRAGDPKEAARLMALAGALRPEDPLVGKYLKKLAVPGWDGTFTLESK